MRTTLVVYRYVCVYLLRLFTYDMRRRCGVVCICYFSGYIVYTIYLIPHITDITKSEKYDLFRIRKIRISITVYLTKTIVPSNALILSRIDYCSSLLVSLPLTSISPLNRVIRSSIRKAYSR